jgi:hypothetical protein
MNPAIHFPVDRVFDHRRILDVQLLPTDVDVIATGRLRPLRRPAADDHHGSECRNANRGDWNNSGHSESHRLNEIRSDRRNK